jgi:hypothetical protein
MSRDESRRIHQVHGRGDPGRPAQVGRPADPASATANATNVPDKLRSG